VNARHHRTPIPGHPSSVTGPAAGGSTRDWRPGECKMAGRRESGRMVESCE